MARQEPGNVVAAMKRRDEYILQNDEGILIVNPILGATTIESSGVIIPISDRGQRTTKTGQFTNLNGIRVANEFADAALTQISGERKYNVKQWSLPLFQTPSSAPPVNDLNEEFLHLGLQNGVLAAEFADIQKKFAFYRVRNVTLRLKAIDANILITGARCDTNLAPFTSTDPPTGNVFDEGYIYGDPLFFNKLLEDGKSYEIELPWPTVLLGGNNCTTTWLPTATPFQGYTQMKPWDDWLQIPLVRIQFSKAPNSTDGTGGGDGAKSGEAYVQVFVNIEVEVIKAQAIAGAPTPYPTPTSMVEDIQKLQQINIEELEDSIKRIKGSLYYKECEILRNMDDIRTTQIQAHFNEADLKKTMATLGSLESVVKNIGTALGGFIGTFVHEGVSRLVLDPLMDTASATIGQRVERLEMTLKALKDYYVKEGKDRQASTPKPPPVEVRRSIKDTSSSDWLAKKTMKRQSLKYLKRYENRKWPPIVDVNKELDEWAKEEFYPDKFTFLWERHVAMLKEFNSNEAQDVGLWDDIEDNVRMIAQCYRCNENNEDFTKMIAEKHGEFSWENFQEVHSEILQHN